jgi:hypothetical protein
MKDLGEGKPLHMAAKRSGMSESTGRKIRDQGGLKEKETRTYRTRKDPFEAQWPEIEQLLEAAPGLEAQTIFETLRIRGGIEGETTFSDGQLRTLQRRVRCWRASRGPEKEIMFPQEHRPGEAAQSDFTVMNELGITLGGEPFDHLLYHMVLPYSNWEAASICFSESFESLVSGLQGALWQIGRAPGIHRTDSLSAATHHLKEGGRSFNERYQAVLRHYGMKPDRNTPGHGHENGDVEQGHHRLKRGLEQVLLLRGSRDFDDRLSYESFLGKLIEGRNRGRRQKFLLELDQMSDLPSTRLSDYRRVRASVGRFSTLSVRCNVYSVPSRLIGEEVDVHLHPERLEVFYAGEKVCAMERIRGKGAARIDYRHLAFWLVRKPGAFARYRYREALFPTLTFRRAYDALALRLGDGADLEYVRILYLAATTSEVLVEQVLFDLIGKGELKEYASVRDLVREEPIPVPECYIGAVDLHAYDLCLEGIAN